MPKGREGKVVRLTENTRNLLYSYNEGSQDAWPVPISLNNSIQMSPVYAYGPC